MSDAPVQNSADDGSYVQVFFYSFLCLKSINTNGRQIDIVNHTPILLLVIAIKTQFIKKIDKNQTIF